MEEIFINVSNFLDNKPYNDSCINSNIYSLFGMVDNPEALSLIKRFYILMDKRQKEVKEFLYILNKDGLYSEYKKVLLFKNLPFKDTRSLEAEGTFLAGLFKQSSYDYNLMIRWLLDPELRTDANMTKISSFLDKYAIDFYSFKRDYKIAGNKIHPFPNDDSTIMKEMDRVFDGDMTLDSSVVIGHFSELVAYQKELSTVNKQYEELIWVSRDIGDGFGYDLMRINHLTNNVKLIEVKGTTKGGTDVELTSNEKNVLEETISNMKIYNVSYHVYRLCLSPSSYKMFDYSFDENGKGTFRQVVPEGILDSGVLKLYNLNNKLTLLPGNVL